ncbi:hypothetical protein [Desulfosarcina ovata]|nr:hypothetical protein [Desulfosarcina ovata]
MTKTAEFKVYFLISSRDFSKIRIPCIAKAHLYGGTAATIGAGRPA